MTRPANCLSSIFRMALGAIVALGLAKVGQAREASQESTASLTASVSPLATQGPQPQPITPPTPEQLRDSIRRGVDFLLETQRKDGAWGSAESKRVWEIYGPLNGTHLAFRQAVTALVLKALIESRDQFTNEQGEAIDSAIDRGEQWLLANGKRLRRMAPDAQGQSGSDGTFTLYNVWGHAYAIHAIVLLHQRAEGNTALQEQLLSTLQYQVDRLSRDSFLNGGWGYYDMGARTQRPTGSPICFTTATVLIALKEAESLGIDFPEKITKKALDSILRQRFPDFAYAYGEYLRMRPRQNINRPSGSLGRSQVCNLAMRLYGDERVTDEVLKTWLNRLFARNGWLSMSRKRFMMYQSPHATFVGAAGYFYYYGHFYAAMCVELLPEAERPHFQDHLAQILIPLQEKDGSWWDFPLYNYHRQYGTAMALSALVRCQHAAVSDDDQ